MKEINLLISKLFELQVNSHIAHLQTKSFSIHSALDGLYKALPEHIDALIETYQGKYGIIDNYNSSISITNNQDPIEMVSKGMKLVEIYRSKFTDGYLEQLCDNIIELLSSTLYKLKNLK